MNNLITAAEAFAALQKGKTVLCRPIGDMLDFSDLDQFPASVFGKPGFEFCIKIETIELAGITFTKPLTIDEYEEGQEVYVISTYSPTVYVLDFKTNALIDSINSGFVQRDAENAKQKKRAKLTKHIVKKSVMKHLKAYWLWVLMKQKEKRFCKPSIKA
ncbi:hypothetical protein J633_2219 [Acinetobacter sp. 216872]|nr:hypothetical protein J633_2219 [Acinetobacter sp. 216872]